MVTRRKFVSISTITLFSIACGKTLPDTAQAVRDTLPAIPDTTKIPQQPLETPAGPIAIPLLIMTGESNSGGMVPNSYASEAECEPRTALQIFNPLTSGFEALKLGGNNLIGHAGLSDNTMHSWENELANLATKGTINNPTYLVKTGQGTSKIAEWAEGKNYSNIFNKRVDTAIELRGIKGDYKFALLYTQGINDKEYGWDPAAWKAATIARFNYLRARYGTFPIVMTKFMKTYPDLNVLVEEVCNQVKDCYFINTDDIPLLDPYHYSYEGQKMIANRMVAKLKEKGYVL